MQGLTKPNISGGTLDLLRAGTIVNNGGTSGKFDPKPQRHTLGFSTTSTGTVGTLVAAPSAGSSLWLTSLKVNVQNGTAETLVSFNLATNGANVVDRGNYSAQGGVTRNWSFGHSFNNTGTALTWNILSGSGTVTYDGTYFVDAP